MVRVGQYQKTWISVLCETGIAPTAVEMAKRLGISAAASKLHLRSLQKRGFFPLSYGKARNVLPLTVQEELVRHVRLAAYELAENPTTFSSSSLPQCVVEWIRSQVAADPAHRDASHHTPSDESSVAAKEYPSELCSPLVPQSPCTEFRENTSTTV